MRILFISRAYPPVIGGIENQNAGIAKYLAKETPMRTLANTRGKKFLPVFLPWATLRALFLMRDYDALLLGDGVLGPIGALLSIVYPKKKFFSIIHGLDITFAKKKSLMGLMYRSVNIPSLKMLDRLIMVGNETIEQAVSAGIRRDHCIFIPNGLDPNELHKHTPRAELDALLLKRISQSPSLPFPHRRESSKIKEVPASILDPRVREDDRNENSSSHSPGNLVTGNSVTTGKIVLLRVGRYVRHKGVLWFLENVLPHLPEEYIFVAGGGVPNTKIAGDSNIYPLCQEAIKKHHLEKRAFLLKNISFKELQILFNTCDLYVSPNIAVPGSMEGFGINLLEATSCEKVVLASNHEGLKDAIIEGKNGYLLPPGDANVWLAKIQKLGKADPQFIKSFGASARRYTEEHFSWEKIAKQYLEEIKK